MKIYAASFTQKGAELQERVADILSAAGHEVTAYAKYPRGMIMSLGKLDDFAACAFADGGAVIFIGAAGIAVRASAPYVVKKDADPAVIVIDELGCHVIPILSGHIGGANALAQFIAAKLGAVAVITTATDINSKFAADTWAAENGCIIADTAAIKHIASAVLKNEPVGFSSDYGVTGDLPDGLSASCGQEIGIHVGNTSIKPFANTLNIVPRVYTVGIGCRRGTAASKIEKIISDVFIENALDVRLIKSIASIDLKSDEVGLQELASKLRVPFVTYSAEELRRAVGEFTASAFVASVTGVDNVCERAASVAATGGEMVVRKTARCGVTVAVVKSTFECKFGGEKI